ncbi:MAG: sulfatase-like hydrolase/transferase, partial [Chloroflexota bacterium]|nr:sulfatase-like hydrolase/transferase [Chloroflexota bacterium]
AHYWGLCALVDAQVGRIVEYLDAEGLLEDTVFVFTADHGDMMGAHGLLEKGYPLHYEQDLRVPLIIADPGAPVDTRPEGILTLLDVLPTVAELTGVTLPGNHQGVSAAAALSDAGAPLRRLALAETFTFNGAEGGNGEYIDLKDFEAQHGTANISVRTPEARYVFRWDDEDELYDLAVDPHETHNRAAAAAYREQAQRLRTALLEEVARSSPHLARLVRARMDAGVGRRGPR